MERSLYERYYQPNIDENAIKHRILTFTVDPSGELIQVIMNGSDGGVPPKVDPLLMRVGGVVSVC